MIEYRIEFTDCRGKVYTKPWVECDEKTARRAGLEAVMNQQGFMHWPNVTIRKRETSVLCSADRPEFINDHLPKDQRLLTVQKMDKERQ